MGLGEIDDEVVWGWWGKYYLVIAIQNASVKYSESLPARSWVSLIHTHPSISLKLTQICPHPHYSWPCRAPDILIKLIRYAFDRARRALFYGVVRIVGIGCWTNRYMFYFYFQIVLLFLRDIFGFSLGWKQILQNPNNAFDRACETPFGTSVGMLGANRWANLNGKYGNPNLRYPTSFQQGYKWSSCYEDSVSILC